MTGCRAAECLLEVVVNNSPWGSDLQKHIVKLLFSSQKYILAESGITFMSPDGSDHPGSPLGAQGKERESFKTPSEINVLKMARSLGRSNTPGPCAILSTLISLNL